MKIMFSCIRFPVRPYPPKIMKKLYLMLVNCMGWQVCRQKGCGVTELLVCGRGVGTGWGEHINSPFCFLCQMLWSISFNKHSKRQSPNNKHLWFLSFYGRKSIFQVCMWGAIPVPQETFSQSFRPETKKIWQYVHKRKNLLGHTSHRLASFLILTLIIRLHFLFETDFFQHLGEPSSVCQSSSFWHSYMHPWYLENVK